MVIPPQEEPQSLHGDESGSSNHNLKSACVHPGARLASAIVDLVTIVVPVALFASAPFKKNLMESLLLGRHEESFNLVFAVAFVCAGTWLVYHVLCLSLFGRTIGQMVTGLRIVRELGPGYPTLGEAVLRSGFILLSLLLLGIPFLDVFTHQRRLLWHDRVSDTFVHAASLYRISQPHHAEMSIFRGVVWSLWGFFFLIMVLAIFNSNAVRIPENLASTDRLERNGTLCAQVGDVVRDLKVSRLDVALTLQISEQIDEECMRKEAHHVLATTSDEELKARAYVAMGWSHKDDEDLKRRYFQQTCQVASEGVDCRFVMAVMLSELSMESVEELVSRDDAQDFMKLWLLGQYIRQEEFKSALHILDALANPEIVGGQLVNERVRALLAVERSAEARQVIRSAATILSPDQGQQLMRMACYEQLERTCGEVMPYACEQVRPLAVDEVRGEQEAESYALLALRLHDCSWEDTIPMPTISLDLKDLSQLYLAVTVLDDKPEEAKVVFEQLAREAASDRVRLEALKRWIDQIDRLEDLAEPMRLWRTVVGMYSARQIGRRLFMAYNRLGGHLEAYRIGHFMERQLPLDEELSERMIVASYHLANRRNAWSRLLDHRARFILKDDERGVASQAEFDVIARVLTEQFRGER